MQQHQVVSEGSLKFIARLYQNRGGGLAVRPARRAAFTAQLGLLHLRHAGAET